MILRDALLRLLPADIPREFEDMNPDEQAWRGRVFLMTWSLGGTVPFSWATALWDTERHIREMKDLVARTADDDIRGALKARRDAEGASDGRSLDDLP